MGSFDELTPVEKGHRRKTVGIRDKKCACFGCTCGLCCCCCIILVLLILAVAAALLAVFLTFREPEFTVNGIQEPAGRTAFEMEGLDRATVRFDLDTTITNPNFYGATLDEINVDLYLQEEPDLRVGYANLRDVEIPANDSAQIIVPLTLEFDREQDPDFSSLTSVAQSCLENNRGDINLRYVVDIGFSFLTGTDVIPDIEGNESFECPIDIDLSSLPEEVTNLVNQVG